MPAGKTRRKDDTWTTEDLTHALKGAKEGGDKKKKSRDDDGKERRRAKDDAKGDDRRKKDDDKKSQKKDEEDRRGKGRSRGDFSPQRVDLTEEDRERLRQERREKRGGDSKKKEDRPRKEEKAADSEDDGKRRPKREESAKRHRKRDDEDDGDRRRRHGDEDGDRKRHRDKESKHRDKEDGDHGNEEDEDREKRRRERRERREKEKREKDEEGERGNDEDEERERRRQERRERREKKDEEGDGDRKHKSKRDRDDDDEREKKHRDKEERHKDRDKDRDRDKEREERRKERERDKDDRHKDRKDKDKDKDREERKRREREEREEEERRRRQEEEEEEKRRREEQNAGGDDDYNDYDDDDFEDYEDDFEDDDMNEEGEMEEVLRALDEENARLNSQSQRSNWSDSTELSDERFKEGEGPNSQPPTQDRSRSARPKTFINFVSAKQRVLNQSLASKARRRADDLKNMIELDTVFYDLFDLPPVREYDLYIRSFGRSNTKQAYVQTNEDAVERDIQTEETEDLDKWTQHPAEDMGSVGGEGISVMSAGDEKVTLNNPESLARVGKFLEKAAQAMVVLMEEERSSEEGGAQTREKTSHISVSDGFSQLGCPPYLAGRQVERVCFCPMEPNMFLSLHSKPQENAPENALSGHGILCVWSTKETASPQKVLTCLSQPTCACFSPSRAALVIAGMHDGSVMLWDLRESSALHRSVVVGDQEITTRFPTYNTAGVLDKENHHSPVTAITAVHPTVIRKTPEDAVVADTEASLSFQLASVEEAATVNLWVVTEIPSPDMAGSEVDLGLAPGGRVKLLRSSAIVLDNPNKLVSSGALKAVDIQLSPSDLNHFFVATDLGQIIHGVRFGSRVFPRAYRPEIESPKLITCLDFSPFGEPYFLAGCEDGSVHLYHTSQKHPLSSWPMFSEGHAILTVQWSRSRPAVFFVLAENSTLYTFDLVETGLLPVKSDPISSGRAMAVAVGSDPALIGGNRNLPAHLLVALDNGTAELHTISNSLRQQQPLENDFLAHYTDRF
ncbi:cytoplasmic dynein 2 intermediate chain 1-like [Babylonia areolata]|uniref:cytoplasmic dynein 2 intermediate chain 1-like n=1 Tax=Babylonia areolata TaxID=304850 RepID=UPI003FCFFBB2